MRFIVLFFLLFTARPYLLTAQLRADFAPDRIGGCSPLTVSFSNTTTGATTSATHQWDFGNGNTSVLQNPGAFFSEEKSYNVTLTVKDGDQVSTQTKTITVYKKPVIDFTVAPAMGCLPVQAMFTSSSSAGDGNISVYHWDFGDGSTGQSGSSSINHTYNFEQTATVSLTAVNNHGCAGTAIKNNIITVRSALHAGFDADKTISCDAPGSVTFSNTSTGPGTLSYAWDFGDGATSNQTTPSHRYIEKGIYTVKLTVTSSEGCVQASVKANYINVANFTSDFQFPSLICTDQNLSFTNTSTPAPGQVAWLIDGAINYYSYGNNSINHQFTEEGVHTVELTNNFGSCQQKVTKQVAVKKTPVVKGFLSDIAGLCGAPVQVNFKDTTAGAVSWQWNFNYWYDNTVHSTIQAPSYSYIYDNNYQVFMTATTAEGCSASADKTIGISKPVVGIFLDPASVPEACNTLTAKFNVRSTEPLVSYLWNFGDGTSSAETEPSHTYLTPGTYSVSLTYKTVNGCTGTVSYYDNIRVRQKPVADFDVQATVCGNTTVFFNNKSTGYTGFLIWNFGDNTGDQAYALGHQYQQEGEYSVRLIAANGMCNDTITKTAIIKVLPPFPKITDYINSCEGTRGEFIFTQASVNATSIEWDFGDGSTATVPGNQAEIRHTYSKSGKYSVTLTAINGACSVKAYSVAFVHLKQKPLLTADKEVLCTNDAISVRISNYEWNPWVGLTYYNQNNFSMEFQYNDGSPFLGSAWPDYYNWGNEFHGLLSSFDKSKTGLRVITTSAYKGCKDTSDFIPLAFKTGPIAGFEVVSDMVCFKSPVLLRDTSKSTGSNLIQSWQWNFGDGSTQTLLQGGIVSHMYANPGSYQVSLRVTDASGCMANSYSSQYVELTGPKASFVPSSVTVQPNARVSFYNTTNSYNSPNTTWLWDFGNGVRSTDYSPNYTYTEPGEYIVTLIAENAQTQCRDTVKVKITVKVIPTGNFTAGFTTGISFIGDHNQCPPVLARFSSTSTNYTRLEWNFGDGFTLVNQPYPSHVYANPGIYKVTLKVYGYNGLIDTYSDTVFVDRPTATINADDLEGCIGHSVMLNSPSHSAVNTYLWDFGNGRFVSAVDSFARHQFQAAGSYTPSLIVKDANGCQASVTSPDKIIIHPDPSVTILPLAAVVCKAAAVQLQSSGGESYTWSPAAGLSAINTATPMASPASTTIYTVSATDNNGCTGTDEITVTVPQPFAMSVPASVELCKGNSLQLQASGAYNYKWINRIDGLSNTTIADPIATPPADILYTVVGYDQYNCYSDTADISVRVRELPEVNAGSDKEVVFGSETTLNITNSSDVIRWNWTPADYLSCTLCPAPVSKPYSPVEYIVSVYNNYNCMAKDTVAIKAVCGGDRIHIPNAFTPNNDGKNDLFTLYGHGVSLIRSLRVYNRWGNIVFEKKNFIPNDNASAWNGKLKGIDAPAGTYVYFAEMECTTGEKFERKGTVTLVR